MTIEIPDWAIIGNYVEVRDSTGVRTGDINEWCIERILSYGVDGVFTQAHNCPVYYTKFSDYGINIREIKE